MTATPPFLTRVRIKNYKSIKACDVSLGSLAFLVGPNGSGKSNFLDALRFVRDALYYTPDRALRDRGGIGEVRRRSGGHPNNFAIRLDFQTPSGTAGHYSFQIAARQDGGFSVKNEECSISGPGAIDGSWFRTHDGERLETSLGTSVPPMAQDRLYLFILGGYEPFRSVFHAFMNMCFYSLNPESIRALQRPELGAFLWPDGSNLSSVLRRLKEHRPETLQRIEEYLGLVVPGVRKVEHISQGAYETIEFRQDVAGQKSAWRFPATNMSDGTLRALGVLTALLQDGDGPPTLVAIEEPEIALHPAALSALLDALQDAKESAQICITSHSPDLLHSREVRTEELLAVSADRGFTVIGEVDEGSRKALGERLFTAGELLRINQLEPDTTAHETDSRQLQFFEL